RKRASGLDLQRDPSYGVAPIRVAQRAQRTNLKCIVRGRRQAGYRNGTDSRCRHLGPRSRFSVRTYGRVTHHITRGAENGFTAYDRLAAVRTVVHLERWRTGERLLRRADRGPLLVTTGLKDR